MSVTFLPFHLQLAVELLDVTTSKASSFSRGYLRGMYLTTATAFAACFQLQQKEN